MLGRCSAAKFLRRSSVESLLRVCCWLGRKWKRRRSRQLSNESFLSLSFLLYMSCASSVEGGEEEKKMPMCFTPSLFLVAASSFSLQPPPPPPLSPPAETQSFFSQAEHAEKDLLLFLFLLVTFFFSWRRNLDRAEKFPSSSSFLFSLLAQQRDFRFFLLLLPNHQRWRAKWKLSRNICASHTRFFLHVWAPMCTLGRRLVAKFLRRISVGSLLGVRCWLGSCNKRWEEEREREREREKEGAERNDEG